MADAVQSLVLVARELQRLALADLVFVGGAVVGLYLTDPGAGEPRVTLDVDVVVDVTHLRAFYGVEERLRTAGHDPDPDGPVGRWRIHGVPVDLIPVSSAVLGFTNRWYRLLVDTATLVPIAPGLEVRVATPGMFIAAKLEAYLGRGAEDPVMSQDLTDIVLLVSGRTSILEEVRHIPADARSFVQQALAGLLADPEFAFVVHAHLPPDDESQGRAEFVLAQLRRLVST